MCEKANHASPPPPTTTTGDLAVADRLLAPGEQLGRQADDRAAHKFLVQSGARRRDPAPARHR